MNILADRIPGAVVWDLFAGSGSFGLECLSCGAAEAVFMDRSATGLKTIREFLEGVPEEVGYRIVRGKLPGAVSLLDPPADIIFMDPPYDSACIYSWIMDFDWSSVTVPGGCVVAESGGEAFPPAWEHRAYGDTHLHLLEVRTCPI